jgi:hypothetical protein
MVGAIRVARFENGLGVFLYTPKYLKDGSIKYGAGELIAGPFWSQVRATEIAEEEARKRGYKFIPGCGSLFGWLILSPTQALKILGEQDVSL